MGSRMIDEILIAAAVLLLVSILASKISDRFGVPALLLFLILGMLAGSEGLGGIYFDDPALAQFIGILALVLILFSGGLDTEWVMVRGVLKEGLLLATGGAPGSRSLFVVVRCDFGIAMACVARERYIWDGWAVRVDRFVNRPPRGWESP